MLLIHVTWLNDYQLPWGQLCVLIVSVTSVTELVSCTNKNVLCMHKNSCSCYHSQRLLIQ